MVTNGEDEVEVLMIILGFGVALSIISTPFLLLILLSRMSDLEGQLRALKPAPQKSMIKATPLKPLPVSPKTLPSPQPNPTPHLSGDRMVSQKASPPPPRIISSELPPTALEKWTNQWLKFIVEWCCVCGRFAPKQAVPREVAIVVQWLIRLGVLTVLIGVSYFVRWTILQGLLGPIGRCLLTAAAGGGALFGGTLLLKTRYRAIGEGLAGLGAIALYFAVYAATILFALLPQSIGFIGMALITFLVGLFAIGLHLPSTATLVAVGGFITPLLMSTETPDLRLLYLYLAILLVGILIGAYRRRWSWFSLLGFTLSWVLSYAATPWNESSFWWFTFLTWLYPAYLLLTLRIKHALPNRAIALSLLFNGVFFWCVADNLVSDGIATTVALFFALQYGALTFWAHRTTHPAFLRSGTLLTYFNLCYALLVSCDSHLLIPLIFCFLAFATTELAVRLKEKVFFELAPFFITIAWGSLCVFYKILGEFFLYDLIHLITIVAVMAHFIWRARTLKAHGMTLGTQWILITNAILCGLFYCFYSANFAYEFTYYSTRYNNDAANCILSFVWALNAILLMVLGLLGCLRAPRYVGLTILLIVLGKVFLYDLRQVELLWKILSAIPVGALFILGAFLYLRLNHEQTSPRPKP